MKILLTGSGDSATGLLPLDLADAAACHAAVLEHRPDWVLNGGAYTAVDKGDAMSDFMPTAAELLAGRQRILVTGGAGLIGGAMVRRLLKESEALVFNLDKMGYASDLSSIEVLPEAEGRHQLLKVDLADAAATAAAIQTADPDLVLHLAAESHVDRSIEGPGAYGSTSSPDCVHISSNVNGTFYLLQAVRSHWQALPAERQAAFRFHHISTDEVFGSLGETGRFSETTPYDPRSPYSASKAPGSSPRSRSPSTGMAPRARLADCGRPRGCPAAGGSGSNATASERSNKQVVEAICALLDQHRAGLAAAPQL